MIRTGIIGLGRWGKNHLRIFKELEKTTDSKLIGVADSNPDKKNLVEEFGIKFYTDFTQLLPLVDAVSIVTPTNIHYQIAKECLSNKKHVFVEKPLTLFSKEAKELVSLAKNNGLILNVGYLYRFNPAVVELKKQINNIGKIRYIIGRYIQPKSPRKDSGAVFNLGVHLIDILNFILNKKPSTVLCKTENIFSSNFEDSATITLDYGSFYVVLELTSHHPFKKRNMIIVGSKAAVYADFLEQTLKYYTPNKNDNIEWFSKNIELKKNEPLKQELFHFVSSLEGKMNYTIGEEEIYTTMICERALESAKLGKELKI